MKKQILTIAVYDGWVKYRDSIDMNTLKKFYIYQKKDRTCRIEALVDLYATNLNELHRVALDVCDALLNHIKNDEPYSELLILRSTIISKLQERPIRGKYTHLIKAVADGIEYLNTKRNA